MKGAVLAALCAVALTQASVVLNKNGCPVDFSIELLQPHEECNKYYQCVHGNLVERPCPPHLHFSAETSRCDLPVAANCQSKVKEPENPVVNDENHAPDRIDYSQAPTICAAADSDGVLVPHENCNRFYKCSFGLPVSKRCPSILLYDVEKERCEWPETVECGNRGTSDNNDNPGGEWTGNGANNDDPSQAPNICAAEGSDHSYVAHENCNQFYQCWAGRPVALNCPPNTLFNPKVDYCDFPYNVICGNRIVPDNLGEEPDNVKPGGNDENQEEDIPVGNNHDDPSQAAAICSAENSDGVLVAHENCNQFYKCTFGLPVALICPANLLFDPRKDRCEWPVTVDCGKRAIPEPNENDNGGGTWEGNGANNDDPSQAPAICAAEGSDHSYVAHENCNQFYQCWAGRPVALNCPPNTLFNPKVDYCDFPYNVICGNRIVPDNLGEEPVNVNPGGNDVNQEEDIPVGNNHDDPSQAAAICSAENSDGVLVAHENCNQFYKCTFGLPVALICPANLLFDPSRDRCEWPETVDCGKRISPDPNENDNGGGIWEGNGANNDDPSQASAICAAEGSDHSYVAHENCNQYYQCWAGHPVALNCPPNTHFNPKKDYCDFPENVDCRNRVV